MAREEAATALPGNGDLAVVMEIARAYIAANRPEQARTLLRRLTLVRPELEQAWLLLLSTDPPPSEESDALERMLRHHPNHRLVPALRARLADLRRGEDDRAATERVDDEPRPPRMRLSDYLIANAHATPEQIALALVEQSRLRALGIDERIGTILLMQGYLTVQQLARAFADAGTFGVGEFGDYLVRQGILSIEDVAAALARQSEIAAESNRRYLHALTSREAAARPQSLLEQLGLRRAPPPTPQRPPKLGDILVDNGLLTREEVERHVRGAQLQREAWLR